MLLLLLLLLMTVIMDTAVYNAESNPPLGVVQLLHYCIHVSAAKCVPALYQMRCLLPYSLQHCQHINIYTTVS